MVTKKPIIIRRTHGGTGPLSMLNLVRLCQLLLVFLAYANAIDEGPGRIVFDDVEVQKSGTKTVFTETPFEARITGLSSIFFELQQQQYADNATTAVIYKTHINEELVETGRWTTGMFLPDAQPLVASDMWLSKRGRTRIRVDVYSESTEETLASVTRVFQALPSWFALFPLFALVVILRLDRKVEKSYFAATLVAACLATGSFSQGSSNIWTVYLINAIYDLSHSYILLYLIFLSGLLGMIEASGGSQGFTRLLTRNIKSTRTIQLVAFFAGCVVFFDEYVSVTVTGEIMRSAFDTLSISREKLAWIVDSTAGPVTALSPISIRTGLESLFLQREIDRLVELSNGEELTIPTTGFGLLFKSLQYRYYPGFLLLMALLLIITKRDMGPMLISERKARLYKESPGYTERTAILPDRRQPCRWWNMAIPLACLVGLRYGYLDTTVSSSDDKQYLERLLDTMKWALSSGGILYILQAVDRSGRLQFSPSVFCRKMRRQQSASADDDTPEKPRLLLSFDKSIEMLLRTTGRTFPAIIDLIFVWGSSSAMVDVGLDRWLARWVVGTSIQFLPTVTFIVATLLSMTLGNTLLTMGLLFPLVVVPAYEMSEGDASIVYATVASVMSGSAAGLQLGPISDTLILSSWSAGCHVRAHMVTQLPYIFFAIGVSILFGTLPTGALPNFACVGAGIGAIFVFVFCVCQKVVCESGKFDAMTEMFLSFQLPEDLEQLRFDTAAYFARNFTPESTSEDEEDSSAQTASSEFGSGTELTETAEDPVAANRESVC